MCQVDEEEAKQLADIAVQTLDSIDADDNKRVVTQILRAQKQVHISSTCVQRLLCL